MFGLQRFCVLAVATACLLIAVVGVAQAAGAFAVGACGAYGYGYDYRKSADARVAAKFTWRQTAAHQRRDAVVTTDRKVRHRERGLAFHFLPDPRFEALV